MRTICIHGLIFSLLISVSCFAQFSFKKAYSWTYEQNARKCLVASDGNYIVVTGTGNNGGNPSVVSILKLNPMGDSIWVFDAYLNHDANLFDIRETSNHDFIICGSKSSDSLPGIDVWILKLNAQGNSQWYRNVPSQKEISIMDGIEIENTGNIHIAAHSINSGEHIITFDPLGNLLNWFTLNPLIYFPRGSLIAQPNGIIKFIGHKPITSFSNRQVILFSLNGNGDTIGSRVFFVTDSIYGPLGCFYDSSYNLNFIGSILPNYENCIVKYDTLGNLLSIKKFNGLEAFGNNYTIESFKGCSDGGYILSGSKIATPLSNNYCGFLFRFDANGDSLWLNRFYGGTTKTIFRDGSETPDGGFLACGYEEFSSFLIQAVVYKTNSQGLMLGTVRNEKNTENTYLHIFPNPSSGNTSLHFKGNELNTTLEIHNSLGQVVFTKILEANDVRLNVNTSLFSAGIYFCKLKNSQGAILLSKKLVVIE